MYIESVYERRYLLPAKYEENFTRKTNLNTIEKLGLEAIAVEFMYLHSAEELGFEPKREELRGYIRWHCDNVDLLDGYDDTYEFDGFLIDCFWMTEEGIPMLTAYEIPEDCEDWREHDHFGEFTARYFRLD